MVRELPRRRLDTDNPARSCRPPRSRPLSIVAILSFLLLISSPAAADLQIELIGAWGGSVDAVAIEQNGPQTLAYVGTGVRMVILDVTDPANLVEVGDVLVGGVVRGIQVAGDYAFIAANTPAFFSVVDVADPSDPVLLSSGNQWGYGQGYGSLLLRGDWAYAVQLGIFEVEGFDVSDPLNVPVGQRCTGGVSALAFSGDYAYGANRYGYVYDMDFSVSPCPNSGALAWVFIPELENAGPHSIRITVNGDYVYATGRKSGVSRIFVVDFSDPLAPVHVGTWGAGPGEVLDFSYGLAVSDGRLYVVDWKNDGGYDPSPHRALAIFDITTDPTSPALLGEYWSVGAATGVTVVGSTAYLCDQREGLLILDCSNPGNPVRTGGYHSPAVLHQAVLDGDTLYVTDRRYGVTALNVSDPLAPQLLGSHETGGTQNWGLAKRGDSLYVAAGYAGLQVLDVSDPAAPALAGEFPFSGPRAVGLELYDDDVYGLIAVVGTSPGAWLVNFAVDDPQNILDVGSVLLGGGDALPRDIAMSSTQDGIAHAARGNVRVTANVSDPAAPFLISTDPPNSKGVYVDGGLLYVAADPAPQEQRGLYIFDVSDPYAQTQLGFFETFDLNGYSVAVHSQRAYLGSESGGIRVLDVSDPAAPTLLVENQAAALGAAPPATPEDLIVDGPIVYAVTSHWMAIGAGVLTYLVYEPGDLNNDLVVDLADAEAFVAVLIGADPDPVHAVIADMNADDSADGADIPLFVGAILNN